MVVESGILSGGSLSQGINISGEDTLRTEGDSVWERFSGRRDGSLWYYRALVTAFAARGLWPDLVGELDRTVAALEGLAG